MSDSASVLLHWLGCGFAGLTIVSALGVASARAQFTTCLSVAVTSMFAALTLLCFGAGAAALAVALTGVGVVPILLLGGVLLSTRSIRSGQARAPRLVMVAVAFVAAALIWATQDAAPARFLPTAMGFGAWLTPLIFVAGLICAGVLGYGERGAFVSERRDA